MHSQLQQTTNELNYDSVSRFIQTTPLKFKPGQTKISYPIITRIHRRYQEGARFSEIKVQEDGVISDGHHRFISLSLLNVDVQTVRAGENSTQKECFEWKDVHLDENDYDTTALKKHYEHFYGENDVSTLGNQGNKD
jgi:hypothetical protein